MDKLYYKIKLLSSIVLSQMQGDMNSVQTTDEISGTSIIGALASKYSYNNTNMNQFNEWFLNGSLKFHHAKILHEKNIHFKTPFSIHQEKSSEEKSELYDKFLYEGEEKTKYKQGLISINQNYFSQVNIKKTFNFHHSRNPETGFSKDGAIFNYESLDEGQEFAGYISGTPADLDNFKNWFRDKQILYFGRSRNSQYGKVEFSLHTEPVFREHVFEDALESKLTITFITDTILLNEFGFMAVNAKDFEKYLQLNLDQNIKIEKAFVKPDEIRGYNAKWKLRRPSESCFQAGSCFLLDMSKCEDKQKAIQQLQELLQNGIGERTHEGYGEALLNLQVYETISFYEEDEKKPDKPKELSEEVKNLIKEVYKKQFILLAQQQAIYDVRQLEKLKGTSTSIVSRLESLINEEEGTFEQIKNGSEVLKNTAKKTLERVRFNNERLYDYLLLFKDESNPPVSIQDFLKKNDNQKLKKLRDEEFIEFRSEGKSFLKEETFELGLNRLIRTSYLKFFFSTLRKQIKLNNKSNGESNG